VMENAIGPLLPNPCLTTSVELGYDLTWKMSFKWEERLATLCHGKDLFSSGAHPAS